MTPHVWISQWLLTCLSYGLYMSINTTCWAYLNQPKISESQHYKITIGTSQACYFCNWFPFCIIKFEVIWTTHVFYLLQVCFYIIYKINWLANHVFGFINDFMDFWNNIHSSLSLSFYLIEKWGNFPQELIDLIQKVYLCCDWYVGNMGAK